MKLQGIVLVLAVCLGYISANNGEWVNDAKATEKVVELANWSANQNYRDIGLINDANGPITVTDITQIQHRIVKGIFFKFRMAVQFVDRNNQKVV